MTRFTAIDILERKPPLSLAEFHSIDFIDDRGRVIHIEDRDGVLTLRCDFARLVILPVVSNTVEIQVRDA